MPETKVTSRRGRCRTLCAPCKPSTTRASSESNVTMSRCKFQLRSSLPAVLHKSRNYKSVWMSRNSGTTMRSVVRILMSSASKTRSGWRGGKEKLRSSGRRLVNNARRSIPSRNRTEKRPSTELLNRDAERKKKPSEGGGEKNKLSDRGQKRLGNKSPKEDVIKSNSKKKRSDVYSISSNAQSNPISPQQATWCPCPTTTQTAISHTSTERALSVPSLSATPRSL